MAGLFGSRTNATQVTKYTQLSVQTSCLGGVIPVGYGQNRWTDNLIWYGDFQAHNAGKGGKGGLFGKSGNYTYTASLQLALGEAPPSNSNTMSLHQIWVDSGTSTLGSLNLGFANGLQTGAPAYQQEHNPNAALAYRGIAYLFSALYQLGSSATVPQHNFEVQSGFSGTVPGYPDANFADIVNDIVSNPIYGLDPLAPYVDPVSLANYKLYCRVQVLLGSPYLNQAEQATSIIDRYATLTNSWIFWGGTQLKFVPLGTARIVTENGTFTPNLRPIFDFGADDYIVEQPGKPPVTIERSDPRDGYNRVELDTQDRSNNYKTNPVYWEDLGSHDLYGLLQANTISCPEICDAGIAATMAALIGQRSVYVRNAYKWMASADSFAILVETGDIVTLTDPNVGLAQFPVRVQDASGDDKGRIAFVAEEFPEGLGQATVYPPQANMGTYVVDYMADPGQVNVPMILEPPTAVTGGVPELWIGASGSLAAWGGANVYLSTDGTVYSQVGSLTTATQQGTLTAALPVGSDPDLSNTLSVDTTESMSILSTGVTQQQADLYQTASLIDQEVVSYGTVSLTGTNTYALTYLRRAIYGSGVAAHAEGAQWYRINPSAALQFNLPRNYVGQTLWLKLCSFNLFGNEVEAISDAVAYTYTVLGIGYEIAAPSFCTLSVGQVFDTTTLAGAVDWTASAATGVTGYELQLSQDGGTTWPTDVSLPATSLSYTLASVSPSTAYQARVRAVTPIGNSAWTDSAVANSGTITPLPAGPPSLSASLSALAPQVVLSIGAVANATSYPILRASGGGTASIIGTATGASYTDTTTAPSTSYTYSAEAENAVGLSGPSAPVTITTDALTTLTASGTILLSAGTTLTL